MSPVVRTLSAAGLAIVIVVLGLMTWQRNKVFATGRSYWRDVVEKAPSSRAYVNYGRTFLGAGDTQRALSYFQQSLKLSPRWYITHLNLATTYARLRQDDLARQHYDRAVETDQFSGMALTGRGDFRLRRRDYAGAEQDFRAALPINLDRSRNLRGLATAYAGLGNAEQAFQLTDALLQLDPRATVAIRGISRPFSERAELYPKGVEYYERLGERFPNAWSVQESIARFARLTGDTARAKRASERSRVLRRSQQAPRRTRKPRSKDST